MSELHGDWDEERFAAVWPETARRLRAFLAKRGVEHSETEDIAQEVAIRAVSHQVPFRDVADLMPWVCTVGHRIRIGNLRVASAELEDLGPGDVASPQSVEDEVMARIRLSEVASALAELPGRDRDALLQPVLGGAVTDPRHEAVIRFRARAKLISRIESRAG